MPEIIIENYEELKEIVIKNLKDGIIISIEIDAKGEGKYDKENGTK